MSHNADIILQMIADDPNVSSIFSRALLQITLRHLVPLTEDELDRRQDELRTDREDEAAARRADDDGSVRGSLRSARFGGE